MSVDTFESRIEFQARLKPASTAGPSARPPRSSSFVRSKMRMFASTAMPTERMKAAMPASVSVTPASRNARVREDPVDDERDARDQPGHAVVDEHEHEDERDADRAREERLGQEVEAERRRDAAEADLADLQRQRAELQDGDERVHLRRA